MNANDGGPAFSSLPISCNGCGMKFPDHHSQGMSLRDYFAAAALQGLLANPQDPDACDFKELQRKYAENSYSYADAMLAAREPKR